MLIQLTPTNPYLEEGVGFEPTCPGFTRHLIFKISRIIHLSQPSLFAQVVGVEPTSFGLEPNVLAIVHYTYVYFVGRVGIEPTIPIKGLVLQTSVAPLLTFYRYFTFSLSCKFKSVKPKPVPPQGFEPRFNGSKPFVLPLYERGIFVRVIGLEPTTSPIQME